jgi:hypothetical protein
MPRKDANGDLNLTTDIPTPSTVQAFFSNHGITNQTQGSNSSQAPISFMNKALTPT